MFEFGSQSRSSGSRSLSDPETQHAWKTTGWLFRDWLLAELCPYWVGWRCASASSPTEAVPSVDSLMAALMCSTLEGRIVTGNHFARSTEAWQICSHSDFAHVLVS